jgi:hypothetical protein
MGGGVPEFFATAQCLGSDEEWVPFAGAGQRILPALPVMEG